ncbi:transcriptional regulator of the spore photoproduct lyase operon [Bacillus thermophilus]|uniref:Transcriptional regulator of the spore photoproduct lyase operon n=1 Tax=Siminovitchia thermophila TaxID=1245522 RepID=A0ABS2R834_9BACI|nr:transcriptional regulator SplA domain-containing protein [Siminovitchia thermophila]MBM7715803.1 transcriptional regulator of the spore photoproduct lyase operon [Siminovitchia thermophila]
MNIFEPPYSPGDIVYVLYRNPHTQNVAMIQEAAIVSDPDHPGQLAVFLYETYYPITEDMAIYRTEEEAEKAYNYYFGSVE